jgi:hypothetical protein
LLVTSLREKSELPDTIYTALIPELHKIYPEGNMGKLWTLSLFSFSSGIPGSV